MNTMQAVVYHRYGSPDVLHLEQVSKPVPQDDQILVKIVATAAAAGDWHLLRADPFLARFMSGLFVPKFKILGGDVAGRVEAVGRNVTQFKLGDAVFGDISLVGFGGFAEYVAAPATAFAPKPARLSFVEAAAVPISAITALRGLRDLGGIAPGMQVLIHGASGGVGTFAVQIAKIMGAEVTAVASTSKLDQMAALGADHVIDYTREDFTQNGTRYDLILAVNGYRPLKDYARSLAPQGTYVMAGGTMQQMMEAMILGPLRSKKGGQTFKTLVAKANQEDLLTLKAWIDAGKLTPVIDRCYPLAQVPDAIRYLETGRARGKVVITVADEQVRPAVV
jgi:NADPH:quinone reductase-like Zn-dependent oxidoreductase